MDTSSFKLRFWIEVTLAGFLYLVAVFFFFQTWFGIHNLDILLKEVSPYAAVAIPISYVFGLLLHSLVPMLSRNLLPEEMQQWLRSDIHTKTKEDPIDTTARLAQFGTQELLVQLKGVYSTLVLFRLFAPGTFALGFSLASWYMDTQDKQYAPTILVVSAALSFAFLCVYKKQYAEYKNFERAAANVIHHIRPKTN